MEQNSQVIAVNAKVAADVVLVALFEEHFAQQAAIALRHFVENLADFLRQLLTGDRPQDIDAEGREVLFLIFVKRAVARGRPVMLEQDVVAHRVDKRAEAIGLAELSGLQRREYACEGFLSDIFNRLRRMQPGTQFELDKLAEIRDEVLLRPEIAGT